MAQFSNRNSRGRGRSGLLRVMPVFVALLSATAAADDFFWNGGASSAFDNPDNWTISGGDTADSPPGAADIVRFSGGNSVVSFGGSPSTNSTIVGGSFDFELNGNTYTTDLTAASNANLSLFDGTLSGDLMFASSNAFVTLEDSNATLQAITHLTVRNTARIISFGGTVNGGDQITLKDAALLSLSGGELIADRIVIGETSSGTASLRLSDVTVTLGTEVVIGDDASGRVELVNGTALNLGVDQLLLSSTADSIARVEIESGSQLTLNGAVVWGETGILDIIDIEGGGVLNVDSLALGVDAGASVSVRGSTSELNIAAGGLELGIEQGGSGDLTIVEGASVVLPGELIVGVDGLGDLRTDDGELFVTGDLIFGRNPTGNGDWSLDTSNALLVDISGDLIIAAEGDSDVEAESENAVIQAANLIVGEHGTGLVFFDEFSDSVIDIAGNSTVGDFGIGTLNINGGAWRTGGTTTIGRSSVGAASMSDVEGGSASLVIGDSAAGDGEMLLESSQWFVSGDLLVGVSGRGELRVAYGSHVTAENTAIGVLAGSNGRISLGDELTELHTTRLDVSSGGDGLLEIESGAKVFADSIEVGAGGSGTVRVSGDGSELLVARGIELSKGGSANLIVEDGAHVASDFAVIDTGEGTPVFNAVVTGANSLWEVDRFAVGTESVNAGLLIENGGTFFCASECIVGGFTGWAGIVRVTGGDAFLDIATDLNIGRQAVIPGAGGTGRVEILDDGLADVAGTTRIHHDGLFTLGSFLLDGGTLVTQSFINDGPFEFRDGLLDVHGGTFSNGTASFTVDGFSAGDEPLLRLRDGAMSSGFTDIVTVGGVNSGKLEVLSGARLTSVGGILGSGVDAVGDATISGEASRWDVGTDALTIGDTGVASLTVDDHAQVHSAGGFIATMPDAEGTVDIIGPDAFWFSSLNINVGGDGLTGGGDGMLSLIDGGHVAAPQVTVFFPGRLHGNGSVAGDVLNHGEVAPGESPGLLQVDGRFEQTDTGTLIIELGGIDPGKQFDLLEVTGDTLLDGVLDVRLVSNFTPVLGNTFTFLTAAAVSGRFAEERLPTFGDLGLEVMYGATFVRLGVVQTQPVPLPGTLSLLVIPLALSVRRKPGAGRNHASIGR